MPKTQPILLPKGRTGHTSRGVSERKKNPRLNGADLYVARLGWQSPGQAQSSCCDLEHHKVAPVSSLQKMSTGSLHEELINPEPKIKSTRLHSDTMTNNQRSVLASRPCYRCISYMNSVGIKRVFWTTDTGTWEGAKVRDLVDAMDSLGDDEVADSAVLANVFVTKHEVLMLRRMMES